MYQALAQYFVSVDYVPFGIKSDKKVCNKIYYAKSK